MASYRLATQPERRAAGFILAAVAGRDLGGCYFPGGIVAFGRLTRMWWERGGSHDTLRRVADFLHERGAIRCFDETRGLIITGTGGGSPASDAKPDDPEMTGGGYAPEITPLATREDYGFDRPVQAALPGLGGTSQFDWDVFDSFSIGDGKITSHLARLLDDVA